MVALEDRLPLPRPAATGVEQAVFPLQLLVYRRVLLLEMTAMKFIFLDGYSGNYRNLLGILPLFDRTRTVLPNSFLLVMNHVRFEK